jgi:tetratricopeptide (TPR) repeat protein
MDSQLRKAYALLAVSLRELGRPEESMTVIEKGLALIPDDPELHFQAGLLLSTLDRLEEAKVHYEKAAGVDISGHFSSVDQGILGFKTFHNLGGVCRALGDYEKTREWFSKAVEQAPEFLPSAFELFDSSLESGDFRTAQKMLAVVRQVDGPNGNFHRMAQKYSEAVRI